MRIDNKLDVFLEKLSNYYDIKVGYDNSLLIDNIYIDNERFIKTLKLKNGMN